MINQLTHHAHARTMKQTEIIWNKLRKTVA